MSGRWWVAAAAFAGSITCMIGPRLIGIVVVSWALWHGRQLIKGWCVVFILCGLVVGQQEAQQQAHPQIPAGAILVMPTAWQVTDTLATFTGKAANGVTVGGQVTLTNAQVIQLQQLDAPAIVSWEQAPKRLTGARNLYEFDYAQYAWAQLHQAYTIQRQPLQLQVLPITSISARLFAWRVQIQRRIAQLPTHVARYAKGLLLGQIDQDFDPVRMTFINLGIFHLFSVSGLHLFALVAALFWLADRMRVPREFGEWGLLIGLPALLILIPTGAGLIRAVWMRWGLSLNSRLGLHLTGLDVFSLVLIGNLFWRPQVLFTFGGQLTYLLTGVLLLLPAVSTWGLSWRLLCVSLPVVIAHTFRFHLLAGVFNWLLVPIFEVGVMPLLFLVVIWPNSLLTNWLELLLRHGESSLTALSSLPGQVVFGAISTVTAVIGLIAVLVGLAHQRWGYFGTWVVVAYGIANWHPQARVSVFDVGQGDAILIEAPNKQGTLLIDTGGRIFGTKRNPPALSVIVNYLYARGYSHLDTLVLTHADADHVGDAAALTHNYPVELLVTTPLAAAHPLIQAAKAGQVAATKQVLAGTALNVGALSLQVVAPQSPTAKEKNADSIVLYGKIGDGSWLFTGDADANVEKRELIPQHLAVDYLKVAHHGSRTATTPDLIAQWQLKAAFISAGVDNRYGHPHEETVQTLDAANVPWWVTAKSGMLWVDSTLDTHQINQFVKDTEHANH
ncbi:ComEC/Rec2 family competence protein [Lacticaseibacillus baoqingensis]|uniref:ComEC/Rec2 family competence protein n=1 Tax=Lacticaseibacillus baoqingensis TaxID=2486013 RepID=A0ABW4E342_9LACO|nr:ComEC/Rec2 family competence protein [Lacticaseibacillus baoqingensis]